MENLHPEVPCKDDPEKFLSSNALAQRKAKEICHSLCPIRIQCLERALDLNEDRGVWGGMNATERISLKRRRRRTC